jgi:broad specificity phosphatase PhoE
MKIGLIRHFKVDLYKRPFMTSKDYDEHMYNYDRAGVIPNEVVIDKEWDKCYCSTLPRAITTAQTVYHGEIIFSDKLIEIPVAAWFKTNLKLPYHVWGVLNRIAWIRNHISQPESRIKTLERVNSITEEIISQDNKNILIVSHAGTLYEIQKLLRSNGFSGPRFLRAHNGKLYIFEK